MAKRDIKFMLNDIKEASVQAAREACVDIMNSLSERGPAWTGKYSSAWYALPPQKQPGGPRSKGTVYKYDLRHIPVQRFKKGGSYRITNGMSYADQAQDLAPFDPKEPIKKRPVKPIEDEGKRPEKGRRGDLGSGKGNVRTAPLDWYKDYINGGQLNKDLGAGAKRGIGKFKPRGFG